MEQAGRRFDAGHFSKQGLTKEGVRSIDGII